MKLPMRVLLTAAVASATLVACASKTKPVPPPEPVQHETTETTTAKTTGKYTVEDLDKDSCLRQRVVYFDFDQTNIKPQFQAAISCHAAVSYTHLRAHETGRNL